jgi:aspartate racemase
MKKIGIIGGIGPESTIEYYRLIIKRFREIRSTNDYPEILINSINMTEMLSFVSSKQYNRLIEFLLMNIKMLEEAGADFAAIASNTPHIVFEEVQHSGSNMLAAKR